jgi:hypothetical protein
VCCSGGSRHRSPSVPRGLVRHADRRDPRVRPPERSARWCRGHGDPAKRRPNHERARATRRRTMGPIVARPAGRSRPKGIRTAGGDAPPGQAPGVGDLRRRAARGRSRDLGGIALARALSERFGSADSDRFSPAPTSGQHRTTPTEPTASAVPTSSQEPVPVRCTFEPQPLPELPPRSGGWSRTTGASSSRMSTGSRRTTCGSVGTVHGAFDKPAVTTAVVFHWDGSSMSVLPPLEDYGSIRRTCSVRTTCGCPHGRPVALGRDRMVARRRSSAGRWRDGSRGIGRGSGRRLGRRDEASRQGRPQLHPLAEHFDGTRWTETTLPKGLRGPFMGFVGRGRHDSGRGVGRRRGRPLRRARATGHPCTGTAPSWQEVDGLPPAQAPYVGRAVSARTAGRRLGGRRGGGSELRGGPGLRCSTGTVDLEPHDAAAREAAPSCNSPPSRPPLRTMYGLPAPNSTQPRV